ncbi:FtsX-like permease family protein [Kitasatospora sp. NBC_01287]|uniref:FtsX-like permease family protein n=1 Tax=Kitasatospora sp. NBC_01287 TaxID=2903573 RepID=UPI002251FEBA|nr:FtsX-like permease family protein [Kitasatospora sp. NBC_01287]MCX4747892.1 FtsX-like permease family protein [Kitasatospora sp. NBC_01287]
MKRGGALGTVVRSGVGRRRSQTLVTVLVTMVAVVSAVVAGSLLAAASAPFDHAFARQRGAHLVVRLDAGAVGAAQLAATGRLPGVTAVAGPYPATTLTPVLDNGQPGPQLFTVGRPSAAGGGVDELSLSAGRWASAPGEIVVSTDYTGPEFAVGTTVRTTSGAALTVVGLASSVSGTAQAWTTPTGLDALRGPGGAAQQQELYRFAAAGTQAQVDADRAELAGALPPGALLGTQSYLDAKLAADENARSIAPFLLAFGGLGLVMSVIIVASVVSGAVGSGMRRIGILKALGFTPGQVVRAYVAQALLPAALGTLLGLVGGNLLATPLLGDAQEAYGSASSTVAWWVDPAVGGAALLVVALAALVPALRAGRLRTVDAIAVGRAPRTGRGQWAHRLAARLPVPRPVSYGLAGPFARPVRTAALVAVVAFSTAAATFAGGLTSSANAIGRSREVDSGYAVTVDPMVSPHPAAPGQADGAQQLPVPLSAAQDAMVVAAIQAQPGTAGYYGTNGVQATVSGVAGPVQTMLYTGDSLASGYDMLAGHWLTGPGQVVAPQHFLTSTGHRVGDTLTLTSQGSSVSAVIVGESFNAGQGGVELSADLPAFLTGPQAPAIWGYHVALKPGVPIASYLGGLNAALAPLGVRGTPRQVATPNMVVMVDAMTALLTLMLLVVAGLGVLNAVVLDTRERVRDLGVCKALGMTPGQVTAMVLTSVAGIGLVGGILGVPGGIALHDLILPMVGHGMDSALPTQVTDVYHAPELGLLGLGGVVIAMLGALLPAGWAARARTATALRTE